MPIIQHLLIDEYGVHLGKYSERLKVTRKGETLAQAPLLHLESVTIANSGVSISAGAIKECTVRGIPIYFLSGTGDPYAALYSAGLTGTVATRREQLAAFEDARGLKLAMAFGLGKLGNQSNLLKYIAKYRKDTDPELYAELRRRAAEILDQQIDIERMKQYPEILDGVATVSDLRAELMGVEGLGAKHYWGAVKLVLPEKYGFQGRTGRGALDPVNALLNYGYGILYGQCQRSLILAGLDPYAGFLHVDRPGKPSLTLDFIEEFRQPVVDRTVVGLANKNVSFDQDDRGLLAQETRKLLAEKIRERLEGNVLYEGKRHSLLSVIQMQARHIATFLRRERPEYSAFQMTW